MNLDDKMAEFLAKGGEVNAVPIGATALSGLGLPPLTFTNHDAERRKTAKEKRIASQKYSYEDDMALVAIIHLHKGTAPSASSICAALGCPHARFQRLLRDYLPDDPAVERFRHISREDRKVQMNRQLAAQLKELLEDGVKGVYALAAFTGASTPRINSVARRYKLDIPRGVPPVLLQQNCIAVPKRQLRAWQGLIEDQKFLELEQAITAVLKEEK